MGHAFCMMWSSLMNETHAMKIKYINLEVTDACNLRCSMCDIWKETNNSYFSEQMVDAIFSSHYISENIDVTLTGGEVFLHPKIEDLTVRILQHKPQCISTLSTNGVLTESILVFIKRFYDNFAQDFSVHISMDGINAHDRQRGKKSKTSILKTIQCLKDLYPDMSIKIKYTITSVNCHDILDTYKFCQDNGLIFKPKIVEYAPNYTNRKQIRSFMFSDGQRLQIKKDLLIINRELNSAFINDSIKYLYGCNESHYCMVPFNRAFFMANGDFYSCIHFEKIGNIKEAPLESIWNSTKADRHRKQIEKENCRKCVSYHGAKVTLSRC